MVASKGASAGEKAPPSKEFSVLTGVAVAMAVEAPPHVRDADDDAVFTSCTTVADAAPRPNGESETSTASAFGSTTSVYRPGYEAGNARRPSVDAPTVNATTPPSARLIDA